MTDNTPRPEPMSREIVLDPLRQVRAAIVAICDERDRYKRNDELQMQRAIKAEDERDALKRALRDIDETTKQNRDWKRTIQELQERWKMGIYYCICCDELRERIDPDSVQGNWSIKFPQIAYQTHPFGPLAVFAMVHRWEGKLCRIASDSGDDPGYFDYVNVAGAVIEDYNKYGLSKEPLVFEPDEFDNPTMRTP